MSLSQQLLDTQHQLGEKLSELEQMTLQMQEVEGKNRALNDKINEIIYNKAAVYKEKTLNVLQRNPEQSSPRGRRERQQEYGISDQSDVRLRQAIDGERMTTERALDQMQRVMRVQSPNRSPFPQQTGPTNSNCAIVNKLERLE